MDVSSFEKNLVKAIKPLEKRSMKKTSDYLKSSYIIFFVKTPLLKSLVFEEFENLSTEEKFRVCCDLIQHSNYSEVVTWAMYRLEKFDLSFLIEHKKELLLLSYHIENWWHADHLSKIYSLMLDKHKLLLKDLQLWTKQGNNWQKRLSLTSLLYYSSQRKNPLGYQTILAQLKLLLEHSNYYVQKGVGWTLRECYNLYPEETFEFVRVYAKKISPASFSPAIEKMSEGEKEELKELRKKGVSNPYYFENMS